MTTSTVHPRMTGRCVGCQREGIEVQTRVDHAAKLLCDLCAARPHKLPTATGLDDRPPPVALDPIHQLAALFDLPKHQLAIVAADVFGSGSRAAVEIQVSNGETMTFEHVREMANPNFLAAELVACTGATPKITKPIALNAIALVRAIARTHQVMSDNGSAIEWGTSYLQAAQVIDFDLDDQRDRWGAFSQLNEVEPSRDPIGVPPPNLVLRHVDGTRLVRASWFGAHVRRIDTVSTREIPTRMSRVGWKRRGTEGRIKASRPGFSDTLQWSFYLVAEDWETGTVDESAGNGVTASGLVNARTQNPPLSRVEAVTDRYPVTSVGTAA